MMTEEQKRMTEEFMELALRNPNFSKAQKIAKEHGASLTALCCNAEIIEKIVSGDEETIDLVKRSNQTGLTIEQIIREQDRNSSQEKEIKSFFSLLEEHNNNRLFIVVGEAGVGKSYMVEKFYPDIPQFACNKSLDTYSICYNLADKDGNGLKPYPTPFLTKMKNGGKIFLDEINQLPYETLMFIQGITDEKKTVVIGDESIEIHPDFKIIGSMNPPSETDERTPLGDALLSRAIGFVLELTDEIIIERLKVSQEWLNLVRELYNHIRNSGMIDVRELTYRDYQHFIKYGTKSQMKFKVSMGDLSNIKQYHRLKETYEYGRLIDEINHVEEGLK